MNGSVSVPPEAKRILVVDDERLVRDAFRATLQLEGYEVIAVEDPVKAAALLEESDFAVVLADQEMPRMTGTELLVRARVLQPNATRILVTAVMHPTVLIAAINECEVYRFILKPCLRQDLLLNVKIAVQRYEASWHQAHAQDAAAGAGKRLELRVQELELQNRQLLELIKQGKGGPSAIPPAPTLV